jgi:hypothetical protein
MGEPPEKESWEKITRFYKRADLDETIGAECLDVVLREYEIERGKRQSFENRAGIVMAVLAALAIFVFEKIPFTGVMEQALNSPCPILKAGSCAASYVCFLFSLLYTINTLWVRHYDNFLVENIDPEMLGRDPYYGTALLIGRYKKIIKQHRENNEKVANSLMWSMIWLGITLASIVLYINL